MFLYLCPELGQLAVEFVPLQAGQLVQLQIQDCLGLSFGKAVMPVLDLAVGLVNQDDQRLNIGGRPRLRHQLLFCRGGIGSLSYQRDNLVQIGNRNRQTHQDMRIVPCLGKLVNGAAVDYLLAEGDERLYNVGKVHNHGPPAV